MKPLHRIMFVLLIACLTGCDDAFVGEEPAGEPLEVFDLVWSEVDRYYAHFPVKAVSWDSVRESMRPLAAEAETTQELYDAVCGMLMTLRDGHVDLYAPEPLGNCSYADWYLQYPQNFEYLHVRATYLGPAGRVSDDGRLTFGRLGQGVGYIHVASFTGTDWIREVDAVLEELRDVDALVVDVRHNTGGRSRNAEALAGRFADVRRTYAFVRYRDGSAHDDYTDPQSLHVEPEGPAVFSKPVAVLTNRRCFSACESFVMAMDVMPHVHVVGDTTGGGLGNPLFRELPNGWIYRVPVWIQTTADGLQIEDVGVVPDVAIHITSSHERLGRDTILETAKALLLQEAHSNDEPPVR